MTLDRFANDATVVPFPVRQAGMRATSEATSPETGGAVSRAAPGASDAGAAAALRHRGGVLRFPVERRRDPGLLLSIEISATDELYGGILDDGADVPDWEGAGAVGVATLVDALAAHGADRQTVLAAARGHVQALIKTAVGHGWTYQDARRAAAAAQAAQDTSLAAGRADWLGRLGADVTRTREALRRAAAASCASHLAALGADDALANFAAGKGARASTREEKEEAVFAAQERLAGGGR